MSKSFYELSAIVSCTHFRICRKYDTELKYCAVALVNLLRFNSISMEEFQEQPLELIFLRDPVFAKFQTQNVTIIVFTFFVQHHQR